MSSTGQKMGNQAAQLNWQRWLQDRVDLGKNWLMAGWCGKPPCDGIRAGDGTSVSDRAVGPKGSVYMNDGVSGHVTGMTNIVSGGAEPPFDLKTFEVKNAEVAKILREPLPPPIADLPVLFEYDMTTNLPQPVKGQL